MKTAIGIGLLAVITTGALTRADNAPAPPPSGQGPTSQPYVTWDEYQRLLKQQAEMQQEIQALKQALAKQQESTAPAVPASGAPPAATPPAAPAQATVNEAPNPETEGEIADLRSEIAKLHGGLENVVIVGDANFGFQTQRETNSTFFADLSPLILWQPPDSRFLFESAFDLGIDGADVDSETTTVSLELADLSFDVCDYLTIGGGLFEVPFGQYHNHFDPPWVDKFPDDPLAFDAIAPISEVGFFAKGAIPSGTTRWTYDVYVANGANLITNDPNASGQLNFNDYTDLNNNKAVGGRIGFLPFPDMETGYSVQFSEPNPEGFTKVDALLQAADFHWKPVVNAVSGQFDFAAEWIWSKVDTATYDPTGSLGFGPTRFNNYRQGGYVSLTYRPTLADNKYLRNLDSCARFDSLQSALDSPGGEHESRYTLGLDYWVTSYIVVKTAYEFDQKKVGPDQNAFIFQVGVGL